MAFGPGALYFFPFENDEAIGGIFVVCVIKTKDQCSWKRVCITQEGFHSRQPETGSYKRLISNL